MENVSSSEKVIEIVMPGLNIHKNAILMLTIRCTYNVTKLTHIVKVESYLQKQYLNLMPSSQVEVVKKQYRY